jgi:hypothetical protein
MALAWVLETSITTLMTPPADLATISPYITHTVRRFGNWTLNLTPLDRAPTTGLDLEPRALFAPGNHGPRDHRGPSSAAGTIS